MLRSIHNPQSAIRNEQGWALLTVLFFSALLAISLGSVLPRTAFEGRREREADLIHRGKQYERAIQLYFRKFRRYPAKIEDLENTNSVRFLRKRFTDPITGSEEWKLLSISPAGVLTNSAVQPAQGAGAPASMFGSTGSTIGTQTQPQPQVSGFGMQPPPFGQPQAFGMQQQQQQAAGRSPVNFPQPGGQPQPFITQPGMQPQQFPQGQQPQQSGFGRAPAMAGGPTGQIAVPPFQMQPGQFPQQQQMQQAQQPGFGRAAPPAMGADPSGQMPMPVYQVQPGPLPAGMPGGMAPGAAVMVSVPGMATGFVALPGSVGAIAPGMMPMPGVGGAPGAGAAGPQQGAVFGGGIAGVASKAEGDTIKVYNGREKYNEWEFVYDFRRDPLMLGGVGMGMGGGQQGQMQQQPGTFGQQPGAFGQQPFGQQSGAFGQQPRPGTQPQPGGVGLTQPSFRKP